MKFRKGLSICYLLGGVVVSSCAPTPENPVTAKTELSAKAGKGKLVVIHSKHLTGMKGFRAFDVSLSDGQTGESLRRGDFWTFDVDPGKLTVKSKPNTLSATATNVGGTILRTPVELATSFFGTNSVTEPLNIDIKKAKLIIVKSLCALNVNI